MPLDPEALGPDVQGDPHGGLTVLPGTDDPQLPFDDPIQHRYELIRPIVVFGDRTARQRAQETATHPETVGQFKRRFEQQGMLGLFPNTVDVIPTRRRRRVPDIVVQELQRLKGLYEGFGYRELARIVFHRVEYRIDHKTVKQLWEELSPAAPQQLPLLDYHSYAEPSQARLKVIELYFQGWNKRSICMASYHRAEQKNCTINYWLPAYHWETTCLQSPTRS